MTQREGILIDEFSKGLLPNGKAAIYSSCNKLKSFLKSKGEDLDFESSFILWKHWVGEPLLSMLENDRKTIALLSDYRFSIFYEALEIIEDNNFVFSHDKIMELVEKTHLKSLLSNHVA